METFTGPHEQLSQLIDWMAGGIDVLKHYQSSRLTEGAIMQRQFTIELRVDFADPEKLGPMKEVLQHAARHAFATAQLISDNPKSTQIAIFADDFFTGHEEIKLLEDVIQTGKDQIEGTAAPADEISEELANAFK